MPTTTNYSGRNVDIALFGSSPTGAAISMGIRPTALAIAGKLKASQNYIKCLLSTNGERLEDPDFGSDFVPSLLSTNISFPIQIQQAFSIQNILTLKWIKSQYTSLTPLDEQIDTVTLLNYSIVSGGNINLSLQLLTKAGETAAFYLPVSWSNT